jgi:hypothetical protein
VVLSLAGAAFYCYKKSNALNKTASYLEDKPMPEDESNSKIYIENPNQIFAATASDAKPNKSANPSASIMAINVSEGRMATQDEIMG